MKWHNDRQVWAERSDRAVRNTSKRERYKSDPEFWQNKARKWREDHPEANRLIEQRAKERYWANPWIKMVNAAKTRAKKRRVPHDLTAEWAEKRWTGFCELTGIPFSPRYNASVGLFSPTIDRIEPSKGYTQDNCRFILMGVNSLKLDGTDADMYFVAEALLSYRTKNLEL